MSTLNLKKGTLLKRAGLIAIHARWIVFIAAIGAVRADRVVAQQSLASALPASDTTGAKKARAKSGDFARHQLENERVIAARIDKRFEIKKLFRERNLPYPAEQIYMRVFKRERVLELWVQPTGQDTFALLKSYNICALSNKPGPKRVQGDLQTPEGYYYINNFNPQSGYHLSLGVNYPNDADRILADGAAPMGGDIYIHGGCKTAGCVAVTDDNIKEIYWLAVEARDRGQTQIPVHIFPARMDDMSVRQLIRVFQAEPDLINFWANLKPGFDLFEENHKIPAITVNQRGRYVYRKVQPLGNPVLAVDSSAAGVKAAVSPPVAAPASNDSTAQR
jgi:murein L,D-transpeptidase YafK